MSGLVPMQVLKKSLSKSFIAILMRMCSLSVIS